MSRLKSVGVAALWFVRLATSPALAGDGQDFVARFSGGWSGMGQLLFGTTEGMTFDCKLAGVPSRTGLTFSVDGQCAMAGFSAPVHAQLRYNSETNRFYGEFLGGSRGDGLDLVGARLADGYSLQLMRGPAQGRLFAETIGPDRMRVTIFYRDRPRNRELPMAAMDLARTYTGTAGK